MFTLPLRSMVASDFVNVVLLLCCPPWMLLWRHLAPNSSFSLLCDFLLPSGHLHDSIFLHINDFQRVYFGGIIVYQYFLDLVRSLGQNQILLYFRKMYSGILLNVYFLFRDLLIFFSEVFMDKFIENVSLFILGQYFQYTLQLASSSLLAFLGYIWNS